MGDGTQADLPTLDAIARRLTTSADGLDGVGKSSPGLPDAGDVSGIMGAVIAHLTDRAGELVVGLKGASEEVTQARQGYAKIDQSSASSFRGY
jgi:hypothetical protein